MKTLNYIHLFWLIASTTALYGTNVFKADQLTVSAERKVWTYTVEEAGDYQIGGAWIEVISGEAVPVDVSINHEPVKSFQAKSGDVTWFENRLEGLCAGDKISVSISPGDSKYRSTFTIAFCTPTFLNLRIFEVGAFGAVGDGVVDDKAAITSAVQAAIEAGGGIVRFDGTKIYRVIGLNDLTNEYLFHLEQAENIKLEGNGAKLLLHPPDRLLWFKNCENVQIDGFVVDYDPLPYYQGTITGIDVANLTVDIEVPERYPVPIVGNTLDRDKFFGKIFIPDEPGSRRGSGPHLTIESTSRINNQGRSIRIKGMDRIKSAEDALKQALEKGATEVVVPDYQYGQRGQWCGTIEACRRVMMSNVRFNCMLRQGLMPKQNTGPVTFSNVDILTPKPETELFVSWRGHWLAQDNRFGFLIENGDFDGGCMYDDLFNIFTRLREISAVSGNSIRIKNKEGLDYWRVGDWVSIWTAREEKKCGMARIAKMDPKRGLIELESAVPNVSATCIAINEELKNRDTLVRNCRTTGIGTGTATCRIHTPIHFKDCYFENAYFWMYSLNAPGGLFEGPRPHDIVFENTYISGGSQKTGDIDIVDTRSIHFINSILDGIRLDIRNSKGVVFDNLAWINMDREIASLRDDSEAFLSKDSTRNGTKAELSKSIKIDKTSMLHKPIH